MTKTISNGTRLGDYTIVRLVGRGGMGKVYEAHEHRLRRRVALKVISPKTAEDHDETDLVRRFMQEAHTLAQVNHPNVVTIYAIDKVDETQFIAMEYIDGSPLKKLVSLAALSGDEAAPIFLQMLDGLRALHAQKILHRDLKPNNLMIRPDGQVKILDFGIAKRLGDGEHTEAGVVVGTLTYLPPEVLYGAPANIRSDLWSLGAIFYEVLTGQPLVTQMTKKVRGVRALADSDVVFPQEALGWIPEEMRTIVGKMCDSRPHERYADTTEAIEALRRYQQHRPPLPIEFNRKFHYMLTKLETLEVDESQPNQDIVAKRSMALSLLGGEVTPVPRPVTNTAVKTETAKPELTQIVLDNVSKRTKARKKMKGAKRKLGWIAATAAAVVLVAGGAYSILSKRAATVATASQSASAPASLAPSSPAEKSTVWLRGGEFPSFAWSKIVTSRHFQLQIATDSEFRSIVMNDIVSGNSYRMTHGLPDGEYYWRLAPILDHETGTPPSLFSVSNVSPVELIWPDANQSIDIPAGAQAHELEIAWKCKSGVNEYRMQVSSDSEFRNVISENTVKTCAGNKFHFPLGSFFWRVRVEDPVLAQNSWSTARAITIKPEGMAAPVLATAPTASGRVTSGEHRTTGFGRPMLHEKTQSIALHFVKTAGGRGPASVQTQLAGNPKLSWQSMRGVTAYGLQISSTSDFSNPVVEETVNGTSFEWKKPVPGKMYWRVQALGDGDAAGPFSERGVMDIKVPSPALAPSYALAPGRLLEWDASPMAEKYIVQWSEDPRMKDAQERVTPKPQLALDFKTDKPVYVRVAALSGSDATISGFSQVTAVKLDQSIPEILAPIKGARVIIGNSGRLSVTFSWTQIPSATDYNIEVAQDADFKTIIDHHLVKPSKYVLRNAKLHGWVYWRVRTVGTTGPSAWSSRGTFEVTNSKVAQED